MHACGHDGHTASLLTTARILQAIRPSLPGTVRLLFQPSEEKLPGGAPAMIREGALASKEGRPPTFVFGQHVKPEIPAGRIAVAGGPLMASADNIFVTVRGTGGHAAEPHLLEADPVLTASHIVVALQSVVSRNRHPGSASVLSIGRMEANGATNVIPAEVRLEGTFRAMDEAWRRRAHDLIRRVVGETARAFGGTAETQIELGYPILVNDYDAAELVRRAAIEYLGEEQVTSADAWYAAEDFAYYLDATPGAFYFLGVRNDEQGIVHPVHTPRFTIDEEALRTAPGVMAHLAVRALQHSS
jgi:hippurate hydrolase